MIDLIEARRRFNSQKSGAKNRGVEWKLTFPEWLEWWGEDYFRRGRGHDELQMQRFHDKGAYEIGNIRKGYPRDNMRTAGAGKRARNTERDRLAVENALDHAEVCAEKDWRPFSDDQWEILKATQNGHFHA